MDIYDLPPVPLLMSLPVLLAHSFLLDLRWRCGCFALCCRELRHEYWAANPLCKEKYEADLEEHRAREECEARKASGVSLLDAGSAQEHQPGVEGSGSSGESDGGSTSSSSSEPMGLVHSYSSSDDNSEEEGSGSGDGGVCVTGSGSGSTRGRVMGADRDATHFATAEMLVSVPYNNQPGRLRVSAREVQRKYDALKANGKLPYHNGS